MKFYRTETFAPLLKLNKSGLIRTQSMFLFQDNTILSDTLNLICIRYVFSVEQNSMQTRRPIVCVSYFLQTFTWFLFLELELHCWRRKWGLEDFIEINRFSFRWLY